MRNLHDGSSEIIALDQGHCFGGGGQITKRISYIKIVRDPKIYGAFPQFKQHVTKENLERWLQNLKDLEEAQFQGILEKIPADWEISNEVKSAWLSFISGRKTFLNIDMFEEIFDE